MEHKNIHEAMNAVMQSEHVGYVKKERKAGLNYSFAGESALIAAVRPEMVENGIVMTVAKISDLRTETFLTSKGKSMNRVILTGTVRFTYAPTGDAIEVVAVGEGADIGDKATAKAMTSMYKYALRQSFCIETGDDPDKTPSEKQERKAEPKPERPYEPEILKARLAEMSSIMKAKLATGDAKPIHAGATAGNLEQCFAPADDAVDKRHAFTEWAFGWESFLKAPEYDIAAIARWLDAKQDSGGAYVVSDVSVKEARSAWGEILRQSGQEMLNL